MKREIDMKREIGEIMVRATGHHGTLPGICTSAALTEQYIWDGASWLLLNSPEALALISWLAWQPLDPTLWYLVDEQRAKELKEFGE